LPKRKLPPSTPANSTIVPIVSLWLPQQSEVALSQIPAPVRAASKIQWIFFMGTAL